MKRLYIILILLVVALLIAVAIPVLAQADPEPETFRLYLPEVQYKTHCVYWPDCPWCIPERCYWAGW
jgi:hypothetical protein